MGVEIERKFLVRSDAWRAEADEGRAFEQGYLAGNPGLAVRVRLCDGVEGFLTIKAGGGIARAEFEYPIPPGDARSLLDLCGPRVVLKRRHRLVFETFVWEIDVFAGAHQGLVLAEVELESPDQPVTLPPWIGTEVTGDERYANAALAGL